MDNQLLYLQDPLTLEFETSLLRLVPLENGRFGAMLERSYFYPTGGGQDHDRGTLGEAQVLDVYKTDEGVLHVIDRALSPGPLVARIDRETRTRNMQHHTAQHLLTQCFLRLFDLDTVSSHISAYTPSTLDLPATALNRADLDRVEDLAGEVILADRPVKSYFVTPAELSRLPLRRRPSVTENIRIVEIDGFDYTPCGGTHCLTTGAIGLVKILKTERPNKDVLRVVFAAGRQALDIFREEHELVTGLAGQLGVPPREVAGVVQRQSEQLRAAQESIQTMQGELLAAEAQRLDGTAIAQGARRVLVSALPGRSSQDLRALAGELKKMDGLVSMLASYDGQKLAVVAVCAPGTGLSARDLLNRLLAGFGGRGGGDAVVAQGGGPADPAIAAGFEQTARRLAIELLG